MEVVNVIIDRPMGSIHAFEGKVTAIIHRKDDVEDKWVVTPEGAQYIKDEIAGQVKFQEQYFDTVIERKE